MWDDLRCLDQDFDIAKANKFHLKYLRKMRSECPHLPESLAKKLDLWERHFLGDLEATKEVLILCGLAKRSDFDFEQEAMVSARLSAVEDILVAKFYKHCYCLKSIMEDIIMEKIDDYLQINEAAVYLGISPSTLRNWEKQGKLSTHRNPINSYRLYKKKDLENLLKSIRNSSTSK